MIADSGDKMNASTDNWLVFGCSSIVNNITMVSIPKLMVPNQIRSSMIIQSSFQVL